MSAEVERHVLDGLGLAVDPAPTQVVSRDRHAELLTALAILGGTLERIAVEIRHLQRTEVGEAFEPFGSGQQGSSAMPHKRNPILAERVSGLARLLRADALVGLENMALWHERDISHSSAERFVFERSLGVAAYATRTLADLLDGLDVDVDRMRANLDLLGGMVYSEALLLAMIAKGANRQDAYRLVQAAAMRASVGESRFGDELRVRSGGRRVADRRGDRASHGPRPSPGRRRRHLPRARPRRRRLSDPGQSPCVTGSTSPDRSPAGSPASPSSGCPVRWRGWSSLGWIPFVVAVAQPPSVADLTFIGAGFVTAGWWPWNAVVAVLVVVAVLLGAFALVAIANAALIGLLESRAPRRSEAARLFARRAGRGGSRGRRRCGAGGGGRCRGAGQVQCARPRCRADGGDGRAARAAARCAGGRDRARIGLRRGRGPWRRGGIGPQPHGADRGCRVEPGDRGVAARPPPTWSCSGLLLSVLWAPIRVAIGAGEIDVAAGLLLVGFVAIWLCLVLAGGALHAWSASTWSRLLATGPHPTTSPEDLRAAWKT